MRLLLVVMAVTALACAASAINPQNDLDIPVPASPQNPTPDRSIIHCQDPTSGYFTTNASTGFESEIADDIPAALDGQVVGQIVVYMGEWGAAWQDPAGIIVNLYNEDCPPPMEPYDTLYFPWGDPNFMTYEFVIESPTSADVMVTLFLQTPLVIQAPMSLGFVVDNTWGVDPPYCGIDYCDGMYGSCIGAYDHEYWDEPRWTESYDVAYCLDDEVVIATEPSSWSTIKTLYR